MFIARTRALNAPPNALSLSRMRYLGAVSQGNASVIWRASHSAVGFWVTPWQNGYAERLIGSVRRECTDHLIAFNAEHLRRILSKYAIYYNEVRTHVSLEKDAPCTRPIERFGDVVADPILGGLHHRYARI